VLPAKLLAADFDRLSRRNCFFVYLKSMIYKEIKIQKIASNSGCFLLMPCHTRGAYSLRANGG